MRGHDNALRSAMKMKEKETIRLRETTEALKKGLQFGSLKNPRLLRD
jgi:hypothetical protein